MLGFQNNLFFFNKNSNLKLVNNGPSIVTVLVCLNTISWHNLTLKELGNVPTNQHIYDKVTSWMEIVVGGHVEYSVVEDDERVSFSDKLIELIFSHSPLRHNIKDLTDLFAQKSSMTPFKEG